MATTAAAADQYESAPPKTQWKWTATAAMASYIDSGSIVAGSSALALWASSYHLGSSAIGVISAFSSNAISAGIGALIGGRICDKYGRKKIYSYDLLVYVFGILWIVCAVNTWMLVVGYVIAGLAVGADVPASWTLITEIAPAGRRGKLGGLAQVMWYSGPVVVLLMSFALTPLGMLGARIVFAHLIVVALITWRLRHSVGESARWLEVEQAEAKTTGRRGLGAWLGDVFGAAQFTVLFGPKVIKAVLFLTGMYAVYNLAAGTSGFYMPYLLREFGNTGQAGSVGLQALKGALSILATALIFMPFVDRVNRRLMFAISIAGQAIGMLMLVILHLSFGVALIYVVLGGVCSGFGVQSFFQLWSGELVPTRMRATAQGFMFATVRILLGIFSFFVPMITKAGFAPLALIMFCLYAASGVIGLVFSPRDTMGKTLEEIQATV